MSGVARSTSFVLLAAFLACLPSSSLSEHHRHEADAAPEFVQDSPKLSSESIEAFEALSEASNNSSGSVSHLVIGGRDASRNQFPSIVHLRTAGWTCGGVVIDRNWILTAAHCVEGAQADRTSILAGTNNLNDGNGVRIGAAQFRMHSGYRKNPMQHDIALIRLRSPLTLSQSVQVAPLWGTPLNGGQRTIVAGWGLTRNGGSTTSTLQFADLQIIPMDQCQRVYGRISQDQICAAAPGNHRGSCNGDSGGPLYANGWLVGVVSWGAKDNCGNPSFPGVYASISAHHQWIRQQTGLNNL